MTADSIRVRYIGLKAKCTDSFPSGTIHTWFGAGDVQTLPASALAKVVKHPTVWELVADEPVASPLEAAAQPPEDEKPTPDPDAWLTKTPAELHAGRQGLARHTSAIASAPPCRSGPPPTPPWKSNSPIPTGRGATCSPCRPRARRPPRSATTEGSAHDHPVHRLPLGAAALAGTSYPLDRERVAKALGMVDAQGVPQVCQNSLDAVSDRDFAIEFTAAASLAMIHISRMSEELILWMSQNFGFIRIADGFTTGSSIMPQKKNPDVPELARGKTGRVVGHLMGLITLMKAQPLAYNKDNQEDKEPLFDTVDTLKDTLRIFADMVASITVQPEAMERAALKGYATATDLADYMVKKGLPFRDAHEAVAHAVKAAMQHQVDLSELPLNVLQGFNAKIEKDVYDVLSLRGSLNARNTLGGTAPAQVQMQIEKHIARLV